MEMMMMMTRLREKEDEDVSGEEFGAAEEEGDGELQRQVGGDEPPDVAKLFRLESLSLCYKHPGLGSN